MAKEFHDWGKGSLCTFVDFHFCTEKSVIFIANFTLVNAWFGFKVSRQNSLWAFCFLFLYSSVSQYVDQVGLQLAVILLPVSRVLGLPAYTATPGYYRVFKGSFLKPPLTLQLTCFPFLVFSVRYSMKLLEVAVFRSEVELWLQTVFSQ